DYLPGRVSNPPAMPPGAAAAGSPYSPGEPMQSLVPVVTTPPRVVVTDPAGRPTPPPSAGGPIIVTTRAGGPPAEPAAEGQASFVEAATPAAGSPREPRAMLRPLPPVPTVSTPSPAEPRQARPGSPLFQVVNTRRITLNFEVKDVGPSGLSGV